MRVTVVGAGIVGALTAFRLAEQGVEVTVVDAGQPAGAASGASFGWINASFYLDPHHFRFRHSGIAAHHRLARDLGTTAISWQECLCWEETGPAMDAQISALSELGYKVECLSRQEVARREPSIRAPERALLFSEEGTVDLVQLTRDALDAVASFGGRIITGVEIAGIEVRAGHVTGLRWSGGLLPCENVVLATGVATSALLQEVGVDLPMLDRPGLMLRTAPLPPTLAHILVTPDGELRQDESGRILAPTSAAHQSDTTETITQSPVLLADTRAAQISNLMQREVTWEQVQLAYRPVPGDGLPVMGACGPQGMYVATMHSGATLAALAAELIAAEVMQVALGKEQLELIAPYRPQRFTA